MNYQKCNRCGMPRRIGPLHMVTVDGKETVLCELCITMIKKGKWNGYNNNR